MANPEHLAILQDALDKKDISIWNTWRKQNPYIYPDLSRADLSGTDLHKLDIRVIDIIDLNSMSINLTNTNFSGANLYGANLHKANLSSADLTEANLGGAMINLTHLANTNLSNAIFYYTNLSSVDLSAVVNLTQVDIWGPCNININTLYKSQAILGEPWFIDFLEKCGVPETMRVFAQSLVVNPIDYYSCFISYSTADEEFCQELQARLKRHGLRVWFAPEEMKGGQKIHEQIYEAIRYHDKLILVLSPASMNSNWVKLEIQRARKREKSENRRVLFPILLTPYDNLQEWELITSDGEDLAEEIRQYYIPDFTNWKNHDTFKQGVDRLIRDLQADDDKAED